MRLMPFGPIMAPAIINPKRCGSLILFKIMGANKIITNIKRNFNIGLVRGKVV
jgi:hypothetical protein